jgi:glutathione S-transferase
VEIWGGCRGPFLFGPFCAADAMYAPVVLRFRTYEVELPPVCRAYADAVLALPALQEWIRDAERETESLPQFEQYA